MSVFLLRYTTNVVSNFYWTRKLSGLIPTYPMRIVICGESQGVGTPFWMAFSADIDYFFCNLLSSSFAASSKRPRVVSSSRLPNSFGPRPIRE